MLRLDNIQALYAFISIPIVIVLFFIARYYRKKALAKFSEAGLQQYIIPESSTSKPVLKFILSALALAFLIIGIANPQLGLKQEEVKREGADIMIALDVSNSMMAEDLSPNRLEKAKQAIEKLIDKLKGDRLGMIVFAGDAFVQLPITTDYSAAKLFLDNISPEIIQRQGTDIEAAINLALESFGKDEGKNKALVIITDGETHEGNTTEAVKAAVEKGITIHTIGLGSISGVPIPDFQNGRRTGFKKDKEGNTVISKLDEATLQTISNEGNGVYVRASNAELGLNTILDEIDKLDKKQFKGKMFSDYEDQFQYFIAAALLLLLVELLISERKSKLWKKLDLFGEHKK